MIDSVKKISKNKFFVPAILLVLVFSLICIKCFAVDQAYWFACISFCFIFVCFLLPYDTSLGILLFLLSFRGVYWSKWFRVTFYVFLSVFAIKYIIQLIKKEKKLMIVPLAISVVLVIYSFYNYDYSGIATLMGSLGLLACLYLTVANFNEINKTKLIKYFVAGILCSSLIAGLIKLSPTLSEIINVGEHRFQALTTHTNYLQLECGFAIACLLWMYLKKKLNLTQFAVLSFFLMGIGFLTKSKTFLIIVTLLVLIFLVVQFFKDKKIFAFSLFIILLMSFIFMDEMIAIVDRFFVSQHKNLWDRILTGRYSIWKEYVSACTQSFSTIMFGYGVCASPAIGGLHAHSDYLQIWYRYGLVGILLIVALIVSYLMLVDKKSKQKWYNFIPLLILLLMSIEETLLPYLGLMFILMTVLTIERFKVKSEEKVEKISQVSVNDISNIKVSVIVPIYKVEKYLKRGIDSLLKQTHKNLEIILVDDGSPDKCPQICDEYSKLDKRIKVIHQQNAGVSMARNAGLSVATGDYIAFFDPDDELDSAIYEKLLCSIVENKTDIAMCQMKHIFENSKEIVVDEVNLHKLSNEKIYPYLLKVGSKIVNGKIQTEIE